MKTGVLNLTISLLFCLGMSACNKEEFFAKEALAEVGATNGSVAGGSNNTQGGVDSGVDGGTSGGSTTGSSTGGATTGGSTGSTVGGVDGSTVGGTTGGSVTTGSAVGGADGSTVGGSSTTGSTVGGTDGSTAGGSSTGSTVGGSDTGSSVGGATDGGTSGGASTGGTSGGATTGGVVHTEASEVFHQAADETKKLDIVWIIDNSGSMSDEQAALGSNFSAFIDDFISKNVDFKMAITTTDTSSNSKKGKMVTGSDTKLTSAKAQSAPATFKSDFKSLVKVGINGSGNEKGLEASEGFMEKYASSFLRKDAYLAVVVISDEEDQSGKSVAAYTDYLKTFKNTEGLVKLYSVVDVKNTNCCQNGIATGSERYKQASAKTAGLVADIRDDFHNVLSDMGDSIINLLDSFALANEPVAGSLKVYVNGNLTNDYSYDAATHSIKFHQSSLPPVGAEIKVTYLK